MIQVEKLSYGFPDKDLYNDITFAIEEGQHCALIGSNGTGKSTLVNMLMYPDQYWFDGKITKDEACRMGYASQFSVRDKSQKCTVFEYLAERFTDMEKQIADVCEEMAAPELEGEEMESLLARYQQLLDQSDAMDTEHYESVIRKQLYAAGMSSLESTPLADVSGGEYKLLQIMREMLLAPNLLILDEPDVFLDFENLNGLCRLINNYAGTLLVVTHNRYLLNHCFNKILHLENGELQEFDGTYSAYRCAILREKLELRLQHIEEQDEIARTEQMVEILRKRATLMVNPTIGQAVNAKQSQLDRLLARQIKAPFIEVREPKIRLPEVEESENVGNMPECTEQASASDASATEVQENVLEKSDVVLQVTDYEIKYEEHLLRDVNFTIRRGEKVALIGANGTGKTTMIRDIIKQENPAVRIADGVTFACLSQLEGNTDDNERTVSEVLQDADLQSRQEMQKCLEEYTLPEGALSQRISQLSGGEQNLLQLAVLAQSSADFLILDEPTSHLDLYAQAALEQAVKDYKGTILMVTHDFYLAANCADYILLVENNTVRRIRSRNFRKMVYDKYFDSAYLEIDRKKQELEAAINAAFQRDDLTAVDKLCTELESLQG